jgi:SAM-dependent methyltransferase
VGIDVSPTSLEHTRRLGEKYHLTNLETHQLSVEAVERLSDRFDLIVSTGVLHHLEDPDAGLCALRSVLKPDGAIYLMLYAPYGRAGSYMFQDYCRRLGLGTSEREIDDLMTVLKGLPQQHPLAAVLRGSRDALNADAIADALLNPRDRAYSVPQVLDFIERNGLRLGRWYWQAPYLPQCGTIATTPHSARLSALPAREQFAALELWRGTMSAHSLVAHRSGTGDTCAAFRFDPDRCSDYVPLRLPSTLCLQERLPAGAAAVVLNRSHPYPDLIVMLDAQDKRMYDAVDGRRTVKAIIEFTNSAWACARAVSEALVVRPGHVRRRGRGVNDWLAICL